MSMYFTPVFRTSSREGNESICILVHVFLLELLFLFGGHICVYGAVIQVIYVFIALGGARGNMFIGISFFSIVWAMAPCVSIVL